MVARAVYGLPHTFVVSLRFCADMIGVGISNHNHPQGVKSYNAAALPLWFLRQRAMLQAT